MERKDLKRQVSPVARPVAQLPTQAGTAKLAHTPPVLPETFNQAAAEGVLRSMVLSCATEKRLGQRPADHKKVRSK